MFEKVLTLYFDTRGDLQFINLYVEDDHELSGTAAECTQGECCGRYFRNSIESSMDRVIGNFLDLRDGLSIFVLFEIQSLVSAMYYSPLARYSRQRRRWRHMISTIRGFSEKPLLQPYILPDELTE